MITDLAIVALNMVLWLGLSFAVLKPYDAPIQIIVMLGIALGIVYSMLDADRHWGSG